MELDATRGGIAQQRADALVNAAGTGLRTGSGVAGALRRNAVGLVNEAAVSKGPSSSVASPSPTRTGRTPAA